MWVNIANGIIAVIVFAVGYYCGYVKDKKEVRELYESAIEILDEAERIQGEANMHLEVTKCITKDYDGGEDECSGGV